MKINVNNIFLLMLVLSPFANADMDNICNFGVWIAKPIDVGDVEFVENRIKVYKCERNNILELQQMNDYENPEMVKKNLVKLSNLFCRFDRNILITEEGLSCVLYSTKARKYKNEFLAFFPSEDLLNKPEDK